MDDTKVFDEDRQIAHARENLIVKSNQLINDVTRRKHTLSVLQQKCLGFIISKIKPTDILPQAYHIDFNIKEFARVCGIDEESGRNYEHIKKALEAVEDDKFWIDDGHGELRFSWFTAPYIDRDKGTIRVNIAEPIIPYLFALRERFTQYELWQILALKSKYSIMIFEWCKANAHRSPLTVSLEALRNYLGINESTYKEFKEFRRNVLTPAVTEINKFTSIDIEVKGIRTGRRYTDIMFYITPKKTWDGYEAYRRTTAELNGIKHNPGQLNIFE